MRRGRTIIIRTILALGASGSILAGSAIPLAVTQASSVSVVAASSSTTPSVFFHG